MAHSASIIRERWRAMKRRLRKIRPSGYEPLLHPGKRGGGEADVRPRLVTNRAPPRQAGWGRGATHVGSLVTNLRSTPASGVGAGGTCRLQSGYEPALHPGKRGGGERDVPLQSGYEPALHPGKRGGGVGCAVVNKR